MSVFGFPKNKDDGEKWIKAIPRTNFEPKKSSKVNIYFT
jgi:hypothetical protein